MKLLILFLFVLKLILISCDSSCNTIKKCGECIGNPYGNCVWCSQPDMKTEFHRCESKKNLNSSVAWCEDVLIVDPKPTNTTREADENWKVDDVQVQFRPIEMKIKARPGVPITFKVSYKPIKHYPLDVYFLIDNSFTMIQYKNDIKSQAFSIHKELSRYTNNVQFGVGTFIEKPAFPYYDKNYQYAYSFMHHLTFTTNITLFTNVMDNTKSGSNYDDPEAGLDALMQVMVCDELKWRNNSRRFIVLFTDSTYHSAGDGKIIGITKPNDMKCHLKENTYAESLEYDYPSVGQIKKAAYDGSFKIIFAATKEFRSVYEALARSIPSATYTELQSDIVNLIVDQYKNAVETVDLEANYDRSVIDLIIDQDCKSIPKVNCGSTREKPQVDINVTLTIKSCQDNINSKVVIGPSALSSKLKIDVEIDCKCKCEKETSAKKDIQCNGGGGLQCGICYCDNDRYGSNCQCTGDLTLDMEKCKQSVNDTKYCKGNGECHCGICKCTTDNVNGNFYGDYCQYNDNYCPGSAGNKCSGNGQCKFNECYCNPGFKNTKDRKDCSCAVRDDLCRAPYSDEVCSGYGKCDCGKCVCDKIGTNTTDTYLGKYCDSSDEYVEKRCKELGEYAYCNYLHSQKICDSKSNKTYNAEVILLNKTDFNMPFDSGNIVVPPTCKKVLDDGSFILFKYYYVPNEDHKLKMRIQKELETLPKANIYIAVGSAIGAIILIGLATLIGWKILVDLHDKREFIKFANEANAAGFNIDENPLYQKPSHSFTNPVWNSNDNI